MKEKYDTCQHVQKVCQLAVYVGTGCPRASMIKGNLVSSKKRCKVCLSWKPKEGAK